MQQNLGNWATSVLKEYLIKGFALDDERLKQGNNLFNKDFFRELLARIREIRASEKMFYEKIKELYATSIDYAELQAERNKVMKMKNWIDRVDTFLRFNEYKVLDNAGSFRKDVADKFAESEYAKYKIIQDKDQSEDFKKAISIIKGTGKLPKGQNNNNKNHLVET